MNLKEKITFIIPSINRNSLHRSVNSLINQTNPNWECIIIYDGIQGPNFEDSRIKTIKIEKTGVENYKNIGPGRMNGQAGLVRNHGILLCDTEWIGFLDDDDVITENYVEDLFSKYQNYDFVVWRMKFNGGSIIPPISSNELKRKEVGISFCYKKSIFPNLVFEENDYAEDYKLVKKLESLTSNFIISTDIYYLVRPK